MYRDYHPKNVEFFYVYKSVEHPQINNFVSAFTLEERFLHIAEARKRFHSQIPWICDTMENEMKNTLGPAPNGEYIIDPDGKLVRKRFWSNPKTLRQDLIELVGDVEKVTKVEDLEASFQVESREIASGVIPRMPLPRSLRPLSIKPIKDETRPFFAKLRAETTANTFQGGQGKLHLGLYLDPLYKVHWNNRAGKVSIELEPPEGIKLSETHLTFADVEADADIDPRQFLIDIDLIKTVLPPPAPAVEKSTTDKNSGQGKSNEAEGETGEAAKAADTEEKDASADEPPVPRFVRPEARPPIRATVTYTVCDDAETFCLEIVQEYEIPMVMTRDLGSRPETFMPKMFAEMRELDVNGDGDLTPDELPEGQVSLYIGHIDYNGNEVIESEEIDKFLKMFNNGRGFDSALNDGERPRSETPAIDDKK